MAIDFAVEFLKEGFRSNNTACCQSSSPPSLISEHYSNSLKIDCSENSFEVPGILFTIIATSYYHMWSNSTANNLPRLLLPLGCVEQRYRYPSRKQLNTVFKDMCHGSRHPMVAVKASGVSYNVLPGIIIDTQGDILMMTNIRVTPSEEEGALKINKYILRISPKVFDNPDRLVEKGIIKKILPFACSSNLLLNDGIIIPRLEVIINDCNRFLHRPTPCSPGEDLSEPAKEIMLNNLDEFDFTS